VTPMRTSRKALAASFVATFAAGAACAAGAAGVAGAAGCDAKTSSQQPPATPTVDVAPAAASASPSAAAPGDSSAAPSSSAAQTTPPPAPSFGRVERQPDGTCMWFADVHCPRTANGRIIPCNPPPPHPVQCPPDGGT
jgi:hypothetical protein